MVGAAERDQVQELLKETEEKARERERRGLDRLAGVVLGTCRIRPDRRGPKPCPGGSLTFGRN